MTFETRRIFKSAVTSQNLIRELLQMMFLGELLAPGGERAWLVSPWISNVVLFDNRAGGFGSINPEWGSREIRLVEVMTDVMARGTALGIATSLDDHNDPLIDALVMAADEGGPRRQAVHRAPSAPSHQRRAAEARAADRLDEPHLSAASN